MILMRYFFCESRVVSSLMRCSRFEAKIEQAIEELLILVHKQGLTSGLNQ